METHDLTTSKHEKTHRKSKNKQQLPISPIYNPPATL